MKVVTLTKTTTHEVILGQNFQIEVFAESITVFCDCCPVQATANRLTLESSGWYLGNKAQFCPECNS